VKRIAAIAGQPVPVEVRHRVGAGPGDRIPDRRLVVRGDAPHSQDSRHFGYVSEGDVLGAVVFVFGSATRLRRGTRSTIP